MSYITDLPSSGLIWFDTAEGWYLHGSSVFDFQETLKEDGHVDNGPYALDVDSISYVDIGRTFVCAGDLEYNFDFCFMEWESEEDRFQLFGSLYTDDKPFPPSSDAELWMNVMDTRYEVDLFDDLGETLPVQDQLMDWKKQEYDRHWADYWNKQWTDYWKCQSITDTMVETADHIGYHIAMRSTMNHGNDVFTIRDFNARCLPFQDINPAPYNIFASPSDSIVFGFKTGPGNTPRASKATVVIDLYSDKESDILRCHHFGVKPSTSYACSSRTDNVFSISSDHNTDNLENKLIIRAFEHDGMDILAASIGSTEEMTVASVVLPHEGSVHVCSNTLWVKFALTESDTETTIVFEDSSVDPYSINSIDEEYGTIKIIADEEVDDVSVQFEWNYQSDAGDCMWDEDVDESINAVDPGDDAAGKALEVIDVVATGVSIVADVTSFMGPQMEIASQVIGTFGDLLGLGTGFSGLFGVGEDNTAELAQDALRDLKDGTEKMIECNQQVAANKMNALKDAVDAAIKQIQDNMYAFYIKAAYKSHAEDVEIEIAHIEDTVNRLRNECNHLDGITDNDEILTQLESIVRNTLDGFELIITKAYNADFDYFWRLYSKEMTLYIQDIQLLRFEIWVMWLLYNGISDESDKSIKDITPDLSHGFCSSTAELIDEYTQLLPMAILSIMKQEYGWNELQRMTVLERFREIELRFQPRLICEWAERARVWTETDDISYLLGDSGDIDLYDPDDDMDECASKVRAHIINEVVRIDNDRDDTERIFGEELDDPHTHNVHIYQYDFSEDPEYKCGADCEYTMSTTINHDFCLLNPVEGFLQIHSAPLLLTENKYVAPSIIEINTNSDSETLTNGAEPLFYSTLNISCSDEYRISGLRFGTVSYDDPSSEYDRYETIAMKLLCRPIPQSEQDLYEMFTDYEIVTKIPDEGEVSWNVNQIEGEVSWNEWISCPVGTYIKMIVYIWDQQTDPKLTWDFYLGITCYDGDQEHTYYSLLDDADVVFPLFDIYSNSYKSDHFWILMVLSMGLLMVLTLMQWWFCLRQKTTKRIVYFDQETSDDENVL